MTRYLHRQIAEIGSDRILPIYGALLAFGNFVGILNWWYLGAEDFIGSNVEAICWPAFPNCESWRFLDQAASQWAIIVFAVLCLGNIVLFLRPCRIAWAYWFFLLLSVVQLLIIAMDYRLRLNQYIMLYWMSFVFLFVPQKKIGLILLLPIFYFWAGLLKLNSEWISGSTLYAKPWLFSGELLTWACTYVVILEIVLIWGLWSSRKWLAWGTLTQLFIFHALSFPVVGFFYPLLMGALLMIYPLVWLTSEVPLKFEKKAIPTYVVVAVFSMIQLIPRILPGDTAVTGEGRTFALHMFDSLTFCDAHVFVKSRARQGYAINLKIPLPARIRCDPIVYLSRARRLCRTLPKEDPTFTDLDLFLKTRRSNQQLAVPVVDIQDFCSKEITYSHFFPNDWILR